MLRHSFTRIVLLTVLTASLAGCIPGYGYGVPRGHAYGRGYSSYSRVPVYRTGGWGGGGWGHGGFHGGGCRH